MNKQRGCICKKCYFKNPKIFRILNQNVHKNDKFLKIDKMYEINLDVTMKLRK